jgi:hypothetical protein
MGKCSVRSALSELIGNAGEGGVLPVLDLQIQSGPAGTAGLAVGMQNKSFGMAAIHARVAGMSRFSCPDASAFPG